MTETDFGPGGYAYTGAILPLAPALLEDSSETALVSISSDGNPDYTEYAIYNDTDNVWLDQSGGGTPAEFWQTASEWGTACATGLVPATSYGFRLKARNSEGAETGLGPAAWVATLELGALALVLSVEITKASSTISAPAFMVAHDSGISIAGKSLGDFGFVVDNISGLDMPRTIPNEELVPGSHEWRVHDEYFAPKRIVLDGYVHGSSPADLQLRLAYIKSFLATFAGSPWRSNSPVRLERADMEGRHWQVYYDSLEQAETVGKRGLSSSAQLRVSLKSPLPYSRSNESISSAFSPTDGGFQSIELGNAPSDAAFVLSGAAINPSFTVGDMVFYCDFTDGLSYADAESAGKTGVYLPSGSEAAAYRATESGMGIFVTGSDTVGYTAKGSAADASWLFAITPEWQSSAKSSDVTLFEHYGDSDNFIRLSWDGSERAWLFTKCADGRTVTLSSSRQSFDAGSSLVLGIVFDSSNAGGMKLFINGALESSLLDTAALVTAPGTVTLHNNDGSGQPDVLFDLICGWSRMLSLDEMLKIATDPAGVVWRNMTVNYSGTLDTGDFLTLDSRTKTAVLYDVSAGSRTNVLDNISGDIPPLVPGRKRTATDRTQTVVFTGSAPAAMQIRYRRQYL